MKFVMSAGKPKRDSPLHCPLKLKEKKKFQFKDHFVNAKKITWDMFVESMQVGSQNDLLTLSDPDSDSDCKPNG